MNTPSLRLRPLAAAILCSLLAPALFAQTATTTPVGFITVTIPAAVDASTPTSRTVSIPLFNTADYVSTVATIDSATQFTLTGAAWTAGQFADPTAPRIVRVKASTVAANIGRFFLVTANTTSQLTVALPASVANINTALTVGDSCEVVPANTLGSVFGTTTPIVQTGTSANTADNIYIWSGISWTVYYHNGTNWKKSGSLANQNNTIIYPDEGLFVIRTITSPLVLTFMGTVPSTAEQTDLTGAGSTFVANRFPVDTKLLATNLQTTPNWTTGSSANTADTVYLWNATNSTWDVFYHNGTNWKKSGSLANQNATPVLAGSALYIVRSNASASVFNQPLPYTP